MLNICCARARASPSGQSTSSHQRGWQPVHSFLDDVHSLVDAYKASGALDKEVDFSVDEKILEAVGAKVPTMA